MPLPLQSRSVLPLLALLLVVISVGLMLRAPVQITDADLWFHLSHGREIAATGELPDGPYFSYLEPTRSWVDYSWLHQVVVYQLHSLAGYGALLGYRALQLALLALILGLYVLRPARGHPGPLHYAIFALVFGILTETFLGIRPHAVSYLGIACFLLILERAPRWLPALPLVGLLWINSHGVEFPVLLALVGAHLLDLLWTRRIRGSGLEAADLKRAGWLLATMVVIFATPNGLRLVTEPFLSTAAVSEYIAEMRPLEASELFRFTLDGGGISRRTAFNLLFFLVLFHLPGWRRRSLAQGILLLAAFVLFVRGQRFQSEFAFLVLPWLLAEGGDERQGRTFGGRSLAAALLTFGVLLAPLVALIHHARSPWPLSQSGLPAGTAAWLAQAEPGGRVLHHPNYGGYLLWEVVPRHRLAMDLEIPFLFDDEQFYAVRSAFYDGVALDTFLAHHRPDLLAVPADAVGFPTLIARYPRFRPVAFDDVQVLYADLEARPELASEVLSVVDPWQALSDGPLRPVGGSKALEQALAEIKALEARAPGSRILPQRLAELYLMLGRGEPAREAAGELMRIDPVGPLGYRLEGDAWALDGDFQAAVSSFELALARGGGRGVERRLGLVWERLGDRSRAYHHLRRGVDRFDPTVPYRDLLLLTRLALEEGQVDEAVELVRLTRWRVPAEDAASRRELATLERLLASDG